jgi:hypothetical protein
MHGCSITPRARTRAIVVIAALVVLALAPVARAGVANVVMEPDPSGGKYGPDHWYVSYAGGDEADHVTLKIVPPPTSEPSVGLTAILTDTAGTTPGTGCDRPDPTDPTVLACSSLYTEAEINTFQIKRATRP